jgi:Flp pilus assembly protein TadB
MLKHSLLLLALISVMGVAQAADKAEGNNGKAKANKQTSTQAPAKKGKADKRHSDERKQVHDCDSKAKAARAGDAVARKKMVSDCRKA